MSRFSYREPSWLILSAGLAVGLLAGFGLGWISKPTPKYLPGSVYDPDTWENGVAPKPIKRSNVMWEIGNKAADESKREREAAGR